MPNKRGPNWLPQDNEQLAKSWLKILEDIVQSTGQKKDKYWKRVAEDYNNYTTGVVRDGSHCMHHWGHIQKATLKFSGIYHKLEKTRPSGSVLTDLLPDTKKAFYEQEGKQFTFEQAWMVLKEHPKWNNLSQSRAVPDTNPPDSTPTPSTPATPIASQTSTAVVEGRSENSWTRPPGVHTTKRTMKEDHYNAKKIKVMSDRSSDYRNQTLAMKETNKIRQIATKAEANTANMEIMARKTEDLPDDISKQFLKLQKESILLNMQEQLKQRQK
ncbi:uncharacterized protein PGTG_08056 [Puccinia graminis f. sp. tritici CRL 75-36-700-3]|uniref:No apical meristem-associated C-terminal domain-containing protein n=1 Tax=Puccinia graminis f. sp. tritici (strain CRL 75-36-700-3 / race SCCL) TaxID=418459 RepID=E3KC25_PUCGT|nr:uncharacterized protein PGTG_08056 [Puccinia graminis f. sp. tritici CRL 75-36-700-3]EFP81807.2 hypothetical protein PGTG_08056 [Puccinia graminis f. sp. tritici CRL 75-36-700-3]